MSEELYLQQFERQKFFQPRITLSSGRVISFEEGKRLVNDQNPIVDDAEISQSEKSLNSMIGTSILSSVKVEDSVLQKVAIIRQKQRKRDNVSHSLKIIQRDRLPEDFIANEIPALQKAASHLFQKDLDGHATLRSMRKKRDKRWKSKNQK